MLERLMSAALVAAAACAVMFCGTPEPQAEATVTPPAKAAATVGPPPDLTLGLVKAEPVAKVATPVMRPLTIDEFWDVYKPNVDVINTWIETTYLESDHTMREFVELWLLENPAHDPRLPKVVKAEPVLYTQPQPIAPPQPAAKPKAAPTTYRYYYVPQRQQSFGSCSNGNCGTRRGFFGRRR